MKDHLSVSQINVYLACPLKYRFQYVDEIPRAFTSSALVFGIAVAYRKIKIAASAEFCTPDGLEAVFRSLLAEISDGCSNNSTKNMLSTPGWIVKIFPV